MILSKTLFSKVRDLDKTHYKPGAQSLVAKIAVTDEQLEMYLKVKVQDGTAACSLNEYLESILKHNYPKGTVFIADLTNKDLSNLLDKDLSKVKLDGADFSGSILEGATFSGKIENLSLRDCYIYNTSFDGTLTNVDLRGSDLYGMIIPEGETLTLKSPKLSISEAALKDQKRAIDSELYGANIIFSEEAICDPCYARGSTKEQADIVPIYKQYKREDLERYIEHVASIEGPDKPSLHNFLELEENTIPSFAEENLGDLQLAGLNLGKCDFTFVNFSGSNLAKTNMPGSNLSGALLSPKKVAKPKEVHTGWFAPVKNFFQATEYDYIGSFKNVNLADSYLIGAIANYTDFSYGNLSNVFGPSFQANRAKLCNTNLSNSNLAEIQMDEVDAREMIGESINIQGAEAMDGDFSRANLRYANGEGGNFMGSDFTDANLEHANLTSAVLKGVNFTRTNLSNAKVAADIRGAKFIATILEETDLSGATWFGEPPQIEKTDLSKAIDSEAVRKLEVEQQTQAVERHSSLRKWANRALTFASYFLPEGLVHFLKRFSDYVIRGVELVSEHPKKIAACTAAGAIGGATIICAYITQSFLSAPLATILSAGATLVPAVVAGGVLGLGAGFLIANYLSADPTQELQKAEARLAELQKQNFAAEGIEKEIVQGQSQFTQKMATPELAADKQQVSSQKEQGFVARIADTDTNSRSK
jgi:uncharacterized protein YjbI with pentapeptide repeats